MWESMPLSFLADPEIDGQLTFCIGQTNPNRRYLLDAILGGLASGAAGSLLGGGGGSPQVNPSPQAEWAAKWQKKLIKKGTPSIPTQQIAGMTDTELAGQEMLSRLLGAPTTGAGFDTAQAELMKTAKGVDITQSSIFGPLLEEIRKQGRLETNRVGRGLQLTGNLASTTGRDVLGRSVGNTESNILAGLAPYAEAERGRQFASAQGLVNLEEVARQREFANINAATTTGAMPRILEQAEADAEFNQALTSIMFPYEKLAPIAASLSGSGNSTITGGAPSMLSQFAPMLGPIISAFSGNGGNPNSPSGTWGPSLPPGTFSNVEGTGIIYGV